MENRKLYGQEHFMVLQRMIDRTLVEDCKMTFRYGERSYVVSTNLNNADRTCGTLLSHEPLGHGFPRARKGVSRVLEGRFGGFRPLKRRCFYVISLGSSSAGAPACPRAPAT